MTTDKIVKYGRCLLGLYLMIFTITMTSCTYDYFEDENNFRLYIPQIERGEIENFYVAIHNASGKHFISREINAPFDKDDLMKQGILRFKLPPGEGFHISCFGNYNADAVRKGESHTNSYLQKPAVAGRENIYFSNNKDIRAHLSTATVYPIGHPEAAVTKLINIDEKQRIKGKITIKFEELPSMVAKIETYYKGLAIRYDFEGHFTHLTTHDRILSSINVAEHTIGSTTIFSNLYSSSSGLTFGKVDLMPLPAPPATESSGSPLEMDMHLFDNTGAHIGVISFTDADFQELKTSGKDVPKDAEGNPVSHLVLEPQKTILFTFKGFTIVSIEVKGWGDIIDGGSTPM